MNKVIYLIRHSGPFVKINDYENLPFEEQSKNMILSVEAEKKAEIVSKISELKNLDAIYCSNSSRAIETAKYIAYENSLKLNVVNALNERRFGIKYINELPEGYIKRQFEDENYKLKNGESLFEVKARIKDFVNEILENDSINRVGIVLHGIGLMAYIQCFCDVLFKEDNFKITFNNNIVFNNIMKAPEIFKLEFDKNKNIVSIENVIYYK
jgi:2,3-bisphosphoglycerate-dependent phosphoglycerate mutase